MGMPADPVSDDRPVDPGVTCVLIAARCNDMHSVLTVGAMTAAPTRRAEGTALMM